MSGVGREEVECAPDEHLDLLQRIVARDAIERVAKAFVEQFVA